MPARSHGPSAWSIAWPEGRTTAVAISSDDGTVADLVLAERLRSRGLVGTFNLNSGRLDHDDAIHGQRLLRSDEVAALAGHEVATHGVLHRHLTRLTPGQRASEILDDRRTLERLLGRPVTGHAYAYGNHSPEVQRDLTAYGITYARTIACRPWFELPDDWLAWGPTCHSADLDDAIARCRRDAGALLLAWTHAWELASDWGAVERWLDAISALVEGDGWWSASCADIHAYACDWRRLAWSVDGRVAANPTGRPLWMRCGDLARVIAPGHASLLE